MNIFGRVLGGFLALISLGWLATIAGIRPGNNSNNQIDSNPTATNLAAPAKVTTSGTTPAATSKAQTSRFNTSNTGAATTSTEVEKNPRSATPSDKSGTQTPLETSAQTAPAATPPVSAGW